MVSVYHERADADGKEMVQDESDQRLLVNRDQRLGQIFGERTQPGPEPGAQDESFGDHPSATLVLLFAFVRTGRMPEETIWRGTASQLKNLGCFILCVLFCWLIVPIFI